MLGKAKTVLRGIESRSPDGIAAVWRDRRPSGGGNGLQAEDTVTDAAGSFESPQLYECPSCDRIFVATDKQTCSTCETAVGRVEEAA